MVHGYHAYTCIYIVPNVRYNVVVYCKDVYTLYIQYMYIMYSYLYMCNCVYTMYVHIHVLHVHSGSHGDLKQPIRFHRHGDTSPCCSDLSLPTHLGPHHIPSPLLHTRSHTCAHASGGHIQYVQ